MNMNQILLAIAKEVSGSIEKRGNLETSANRDDNYIDIAVCQIQEMLIKAYRAGRASMQNDMEEIRV